MDLHGPHTQVYPDSGAQIEAAAKSALQLAGIWNFPMDLIKGRGVSG